MKGVRTFPARGILCLALAAGTLFPRFAASNPPEVLSDGGFDEVDGRVSTSWQLQGRAGLTLPGAVGGHALLLRGKGGKKSAARQQISLPQPLPLVATISCLVKARRIASVDKEGGGAAEVRVSFLDGAGREIRERKLDDWRGSFDWQPWAGLEKIPAGARNLVLILQVQDVQGDMLFDEVKLAWGFPHDQDQENLLVDGDFERVGPLTEWKWGRGHGVVFPGFHSTGALKISPKKGRDSATEQRVILSEGPFEKVALSFELKQEVRISKKGGLAVQLDWLNGEGRLVQTQKGGPWNGGPDWMSVHEEMAVPSEARGVRFQIFLEKTKGAAFVDNLRLEILGKGGQPLSRPLESVTPTGDWEIFRPPPGPLEGLLDVSFLLDPPAGKHGFLGVKGGKFVFEDGIPVRFWGINVTGGHTFPSHDEAVRLAERLAQHGFNLVRLHQLDSPWARPNIFDPEAEDARHFSKESLDRLDYFIAQLKAHGIHVYLDLLVTRLFTSKDGVNEAKRLGKGAKVVAQFDRRLIDLQKEYAKNLLRHFNPYTKMRYVDDPAFVLVGLINESSAFEIPEKFRTFPEFYQQELRRQWEEFVNKESGGNPQDRSSFEEGHPLAETFFENLQSRYFDEMSKFLRKQVGLRIPIAGSNLALEGGDLRTNARLDFIDRHAYWDHPKGGFGEMIKFNNDLLLTVVQRHNLLAKLARQRVKGKPFVVSEWNIAWPNEYRAAGPLLMAAYALYQDWDGVIQFDYEGRLAPERIEGNFDTSTKPEIFLQYAASARLFHRRDVAKAGKWTTYPLEGVSVPPDRVFLEGVERRLDKDVSFANMKEAFPYWGRVYPSDTKELTWDAKNGAVRIETSRTLAAIGRFKKVDFESKHVNFNVTIPFTVISLSSVDGRPVDISRHLLLTAVARSENSSTVYHPNRNSLRESGSAPILLEKVRGEVSIDRNGRPLPEIYALDAAGKQIRKIGGREKGGRVLISLGEAPLYEIRFGDEKPLQ